MALEVGDWIELGQVFKDSLEHVLRNAQALEQATQDRIQRFVYVEAFYKKPYMLVTPQGVKSAIEMVFGDEILRDFVLSLTYHFYSRWGTTNEKFLHLVDTLAFAVSVDGPPASNTALPYQSGIPPQVQDDMASSETVRPTLLANKWIVIILLLQLVVAMPDLKAPAKNSRRNQAAPLPVVQ
jgi:hypothetical protein